MLPKFLRPEVIPFAAVEVLPAPPAPREDDDDVDDRDELLGATCGAWCGHCGRCS